MIKKILFLHLVILGLVFSQMAGECLADASTQLKQANMYTRKGYLKRAEKIYKDTLRNYPGTDDALKAQRGLVSLYISAERVDRAQAAIDKLAADFSAEPNPPTALRLIALRYQEVGKYEEAESIYQGIITDYLATDEALKAQRGLVALYISAERDNDVQAAMDKLTTDFSDHPDLPLMLRQIAKRYEEVEKYEEARSVYETIVTDFPDTHDALKAQMNLVILYISTKRDNDVQAALDKLSADFSGHPDLPLMLRQIANRYKQVEKYEEAESIYRGIVTDFSDTNDALNAQFNLAKINASSLIDSGETEAAQAAIDSLIANFPDHPVLPRVLRNFAEKYRKSKKYEQAGDIYQQVAQHHPDSTGVTRAQLDTSRMDVFGLIDSGNDAAAQAAIESLIADFNDYQRLPQVLRYFAQKYRAAGKYDQAQDIYETIATDFPDTNDALRAQMDASLMNILSFIKGGYDAAATAAIDKLIADYKDHPRLPQAVFQIGEEYYNKAFQMENEGLGAQARDCFTKAINIWGRVITELPISTPHTTYAYHFSAACYRRLGQYGNAIEYYQKVVDNWPDYKYAWNAQFLIGRSYEDLEKSGLILESEADPMIRAAYEQLLEKYPDCAAAKIARRWLSRLK